MPKNTCNQKRSQYFNELMSIKKNDEIDILLGPGILLHLFIKFTTRKYCLLRKLITSEIVYKYIDKIKIAKKFRKTN